ncbi:hypothetical protein HDF26_004569 [Pedobacter cryoconitis]|uniref:Uncharacterized protein n=1 Tax=Pedobacter cryoconitis TaxID=188932 RepID=A0A7W8ZJR6_9SPHI|nr:hypothetical protein [Pedobacter cryoconitis]MBB6274096.1 hypothetical protein [Pedobacter cryoconitis]
MANFKVICIIKPIVHSFHYRITHIGYNDTSQEKTINKQYLKLISFNNSYNHF